MVNFWSPKWIIENFLTTYWVGTAISVAGALYGASKAGDAADAQVDSAQQGIDQIKAIGDRTREDTAPYRALGSGSVSKLSALLGIGYTPTASSSNLVTADDKGNFIPNAELYANDPAFKAEYDRFIAEHYAKYGTNPNVNVGSNLAGTNAHMGDFIDLNGYNAKQKAAYEGQDGFGSLMKKFNQEDLDSDLVYQNGLQFGLNQGTKAIENRARALGGLDSGSATKAAIQFGNDYATTKTEGAYNRNANEKSTIYNMLMGGTGVGQNAVNTDASTGTNIATALAGQYASQGNARAAGDIAQGNAISGIADAIGSVF